MILPKSYPLNSITRHHFYAKQMKVT